MSQRVLIGAIVAAALATPFSLSAQSQSDYARGNVQFFSTDLSFSARSNFNGTEARGSARFTSANLDPNQVVEGDVTCLQVLNNIATIAGVITNVRNPQQNFTGIHGFQIQVTDTGKFDQAPDTVSSFFTLAAPNPAACPVAAPGGSPVTEGEVVVSDAF